MWNLKAEANEPYAYVESLFTEEELKKLLQLANDDKKEKGEVFEGKSSHRNSHVRWISEHEDIDLHFAYRKLTDAILMLNEKFFNFDLNHIETLQFTEYRVGQFYKQHRDFGYQRGVYRKLSLVVQLTDENTYEGGDLMLYDGTDGGIKSPRKQNTLIAFPSWTVHEVLPVTKGTRHSLVGWVHGTSRFK